MNLISEDYLMHHGVKGMKWGVRKDQRVINSRNNLRNAKKQYVKASRKAAVYGITHPGSITYFSKNHDTYDKLQSDVHSKEEGIGKARVDYYKTIKSVRNEGKVNKALKANKQLDKDINSFKPHAKSGITTKKGKSVLTSKDVNNIIRSLNQQKINNISKYDEFDRGIKETQKLMKKLSKNYTISYNTETKKYTLYDK